MRTFRTLLNAPGSGAAASAATPAPATAASLAAAGHVHWGWLGKQYRAFARRLEAVGGVSGGAAAKAAATGVHPQYTECGYYYQAAASCALERRKCAERLIAVAALAPPAAGAAVMTLAPAAAPAAEPPAAFKPGINIDGVPATTVALELGVWHEVSVAADSGAVIELLTKAYEQFKQSRQLRMILFLATQMAEEYFYAQNFAMAKRFYERVAKTYQKESWCAPPPPSPLLAPSSPFLAPSSPLLAPSSPFLAHASPPLPPRSSLTAFMLPRWPLPSPPLLIRSPIPPTPLPEPYRAPHSTNAGHGH